MDISELGQEFDFVDTVTVERNEEGQIALKMPQNRYDKSDEIPVHQYGWGPFCKFYADTFPYKETAGVYIFTANHQIVYIGETVNIHSRIQAGYSNISPKNCFEGGQQTNCRINNAILEIVRNRGQVALWVMEAEDRKQREAELIEECNPSWNFEALSITTARRKQSTRVDDIADQQIATHRESSTSQSQSTSGKYAPLYDHLKNADSNTIHVSFEKIEDILDAPLPTSAREYEVWWNPTGHSHAEGWAELGWTADPDLDREMATFEKI
ncbi:GIY-YIG nuclease family protein [Natrinema salaciae]|uniref:GIY-YIG domain-containing protein n=1 Tax=Natrinema salaciae TaxID=1186196 RepID=A0A1H9PRQ4_9EURY|nr:GIY-YIG nuclease family protein [Natrinema salaciae]SER50780.1 hypothetical protein SAMN04489841_3952 [Natrinema salaciae]